MKIELPQAIHEFRIDLTANILTDVMLEWTSRVDKLPNSIKFTSDFLDLSRMIDALEAIACT